MSKSRAMRCCIRLGFVFRNKGWQTQMNPLHRICERKCRAHKKLNWKFINWIWFTILSARTPVTEPLKSSLFQNAFAKNQLKGAIIKLAFQSKEVTNYEITFWKNLLVLFQPRKKIVSFSIFNFLFCRKKLDGRRRYFGTCSVHHSLLLLFPR